MNGESFDGSSLGLFWFVFFDGSTIKGGVRDCSFM